MALPAFEMLIVSWLSLQETIPELAHYIGVGIAKIQEYVKKGRQSRIYALAMSKLFPINQAICLQHSFSYQSLPEDGMDQ